MVGTAQKSSQEREPRACAKGVVVGCRTADELSVKLEPEIGRKVGFDAWNAKNQNGPLSLAQSENGDGSSRI